MDHVKKMLEDASKSGNEAKALKQKQVALALLMNTLSPRDMEIYVCTMAQLVVAEERLLTMEPTLDKTFQPGELARMIDRLEAMNKHITAHLSEVREALQRGILTP